MRTKLSISILFCIIAVSTWAQTYKNTYTPSVQQEQEVIQSQQIMTTSAHGGTIYEPFSNTTPSEQSAVGAAQPAQVNGPRKFPKPGETGQSDEFPLGDAMWPLMLCAVAFAAGVAVRRRKKA